MNIIDLAGIILLVGIVGFILFIAVAIIYNIVYGIVYLTAPHDKKLRMKARKIQKRREAQARWEEDAPRREALRLQAEARKAKEEANRVEVTVRHKVKSTRKRSRKGLGYYFVSGLLSGMKPRKPYTRKGTSSRRGVYAYDAWKRKKPY